MKVNELIEAVSISHQETQIEQIIKNGLMQAVGELYTLKGKFKKEEKKFSSGELTPLRNQVTPFLVKAIQKNLAHSIKTGLGKQYTIESVEFEDMATNTSAYVSDYDLVINAKWPEHMAKFLTESMNTVVMDNYDTDSFTDGYWFMAKAIGSHEREFVRSVFDINTKIVYQINKLASTLVHELVHIKQHMGQHHRDDTEYRSYLEKNKGELVALGNRRMSAGALEPGEEGRYWDLYLSSPQEIPAFSHQIALKIVNDSGVKDARTVDELNQVAATVDAEWIVSAISEQLKGRFHNPVNQHEYAILKKYMKATYTEFVAYVNHLRAQLQKQQAQQPQF